MNSKIVVLRPRLTGRRFEKHGIPVELLKDFAVLGEMIIEVAKYQFLKDHPKRQRIPRGFTQDVSFELLAIEKGSAVPVLVISSTTPTLLPSPAMEYFERAYQSIIRAIYLASKNKEEEIVKELPPRFLSYFDRIGRGLREDEAIEFPFEENKENKKIARFTPETRRILTLASRAQEFTEEVQLRGTVPEVDQSTRTFHIQLVDGTKVRAPLEEQYLDTILEATKGYRSKQRILIQGIGRFGRDQKLVHIDSIEHVTLLDPLDVPSRLEELERLEDGWLDGEGRALDKRGIRWFAEMFERFFPYDLPLPYVYPTVEGNIRLEWTFGTCELSLEVDLKNHRGEWLAVDVETDEEEYYEVNLDKVEDWEKVCSSIRNYMGKGPEEGAQE